MKKMIDELASSKVKVQIGVDSRTEYPFSVNNLNQHLISNIEKLYKKQIPVSLNIVLFGQNNDELESLIKFSIN